ncbi:MAG: bifunctional riboflavin kinase/FAD synthetase [Actinobacteria bacterium]|uniref:Bifunctional riboflavin kinase/FMN adenylyltransferase n=1 Tax=freshwater metagenome TaxID=449393 RepID=A0A6J6WTQ3_9ZZZZ|nr:bifunctional riboflavin kinase/FAD synthetase [Actinomycetota bacterium]
MQVIRDNQPSDNSKRSVVTIGAYDGVHRGHQAVIGQVRNEAQQLGCQSVVVTFDKHPASVVRPESAPKLLTDLDQKLELLQQTGIDATLIVEFNRERSTEDPALFVKRVLVDALRAQVVVVGEDFHFGFNRGGNVAMLRELGKQFDFQVEPVKLIARPDGVEEPVSSTSIRRALAGGQVETATNLLGRAYEVRGVVVNGDKRGRIIGFPTANVEVPNAMCLPADGVYAGKFQCDDGSVHACAINLGRRPTFFEHADHSLLEAHLLDFDGDLYGQKVSVTFEHFLRSERKFDGLEAIKTQLQLDVAAARLVS